MRLKEFIQEIVKDVKGSSIELDLAVYGSGDSIWVSTNPVQGQSRIKFTLKVKKSKQHKI